MCAWLCTRSSTSLRMRTTSARAASRARRRPSLVSSGALMTASSRRCVLRPRRQSLTSAGLPSSRRVHLTYALNSRSVRSRCVAHEASLARVQTLDNVAAVQSVMETPSKCSSALLIGREPASTGKSRL